MRKFEEPIVSISALEVSDVITTSVVCETDCATNVCPTETILI